MQQPEVANILRLAVQRLRLDLALTFAPPSLRASGQDPRSRSRLGLI